MPKGVYNHKHHSKGEFKKGHVMPEETKQKISKSLMGNNNGLGYKHTIRAKQKISESNKGRITSEETKQKISEAEMGKIISEATKRKLSEYNKGKHYSPNTEFNKGQIPWNKGKYHSEETKKKISKSHIGKHHTEETKKKMGKARIGKIPISMQRPGKWRNIKRGYYNINGVEIFFRSKMEANYALYLEFLIKQKQIEKWTYEEDVFIFEKIKFGTRSYRPDFKIYNLDNTFEYHEVKGYMDTRSKTKIKRMAKYYPNIELIIIDQYVYKDIKMKLGKMLKFY